tara:strand:- start:14 stop:1072 length:1059 start_codon:yes stop_codon:yes gene_type:complete
MKNLKKILIEKNKTIKDAIDLLNSTSSRIIIIADRHKKLLGTITDGDIRRALLENFEMQSLVQEIMNKNPVYSYEKTKDEIIVGLMKKNDIQHIPIVNKKLQIVDLKVLQNLVFPKEFKNIIFIMAGGFGKRLLPLTKYTPKPMLKINDKPILEIIIDQFINLKFNNFYISTFYKSNIIKKYFGDGSQWNIKIDYINEKKPLGTAGSLGLLPKNIGKEPVIVINGDILVNFNFHDFIEFHKKNKNKITIALRAKEDNIEYGVVQLSSSKRVKNIIEKPKTKYLVNAGIYILNQDVIRKIKKNMKIDMTDLINENIKKNMKVGAYLMHEDWIDMGKEDDYKKASRVLNYVNTN